MEKYFKLEKLKDVTVIRFLFTEISMSEAEELKMQLYDLITGDSRNFVINLDKLIFLPSLVLGVLVSFSTRIREAVGGRLVFASLTEQMKTVFRVTKLKNIFLTYETQEEALRSFKKTE